MKRLQHATDATYRKAISVERDLDADEHDPHELDAGRLPMARFTWGYVSGLGWGFLRPWEQQALFPAKGSQRGIGNSDRHHEPFWILRVRGFDGAFRHRNHDYVIEGRYWQGWVWRASWGKWWQFWRARWKLLDPDNVTDDPGKADDWGEREGETW